MFWGRRNRVLKNLLTYVHIDCSRAPARGTICYVSTSLMRIVWFSVIACVISVITIAVLGKTMYADAEGRSIVVIRDVIRKGSHELSGMVTVEKVCDELSTNVAQINSASYYLDFQTWEVPYRDCGEEGIPRVFNVMVSAPSAGVRFSAGLNGKPLSVVILPQIGKIQHE